jgi:hypothetical protein
MQGFQIVINKKFLRKKINIRKEIRKEIKVYFFKRKSYIQKTIVIHPMKMMIVTVIQGEYSSWH